MFWNDEGKFIFKHEYRIVKYWNENILGEKTNPYYMFQVRWVIFGIIPLWWVSSPKHVFLIKYNNKFEAENEMTSFKSIHSYKCVMKRHKTVV